jgi:hypothetical protein
LYAICLQFFNSSNHSKNEDPIYSKLHLQSGFKVLIEWTRSFFTKEHLYWSYRAFTITSQYFPSTLLWIWIKYGYTRFLLVVHKLGRKWVFQWNKNNNQITFVVSFVYKWKTSSIPVHRYNNSMLSPLNGVRWVCVSLRWHLI